MNIQITGVTSGLSPYDVFICDPSNTYCFYVSGVTSIPPNVVINSESFFPNENVIYIKIIDANGCIMEMEVDCGSYLLQETGFYILQEDGFRIKIT